MDERSLWVPTAGPAVEGKIRVTVGRDLQKRPVVWAFTDELALRRWTSGPAVAIGLRDLAAVAIREGAARLVLNVSGPRGHVIEARDLEAWGGPANRGEPRARQAGRGESDLATRAVTLARVGTLQLLRRRPVRARVALRKALQASSRIGLASGQADALMGLAWVALVDGSDASAAALARTAASISPHVAPQADRLVLAIREGPPARIALG